MLPVSTQATVSLPVVLGLHSPVKEIEKELKRAGGKVALMTALISVET